ncbi:MAG: hypothetical protein QGD94_03375 [Planctomycetia bacterium]|nr:hypothetical protein [Planctomycetia bacterium]
MGATVTADTSYAGGFTHWLGKGRHIISGKIVFDSSYLSGGEDVSSFFVKSAGGKYKDGDVEQVNIETGVGAPYQFQYDYANNTVKVFSRAPAIVYEEVHTIASNAIKLDYPAAAIINCASATATQLMIEASDILAANEVQLSAAMSAGVRPTLDFHSSTSGAIKTTYITQAWQAVWVNRNAESSLTRTVHVADFGETVAFLESCHPKATGTSITSRPLYVRAGDTAGTLEAEVDFTDSAGTPAGSTTLPFASGDAMTTCTATYITLPTSGFLFDRFLEDQDNTIATGASAANTPARPILFQSLCGQIPDFHAAGARAAHHLQMSEQDALGTGQEFYIRYGVRPSTGITGHITLNDSTTDAVSMTYVYGIPEEIPNLTMLEVPDGTDLSGVTANFFVSGRTITVL